MKTSPLRIEASADAPAATMYLYDEIGPSAFGLIDAASVITALAQLNGLPINVRINSPGGDVFEAFAIYNALARHNARVDVDIDALAASAASLVAMAGQTVRIAQNAFLMIHNAWSIAIGDAAEMRKTADALDKVTDGIADTYAARSGIPLETIKPLMAAETWLSATEAVERGFCDAIGQPLSVTANRGAQRFRNAPPQLFHASHSPAPQKPPVRSRVELAAVRSRNDRARAGKAAK